ncbi:MAG TPA: SufS family cysteine desulfurase [Solirubrobacteraceae bacterium]|nr:SufS family cysteine desulfurase [Solirubrobacteraceae bacterium]
MPALADTALAHEFPILRREGLVYLDSAATSQKPRVVIEAMEDLLARHNANVHRAVYPLGVEADERYEGARGRIAAFTGSTPAETIVTKNATEALNLVAHTWGREHVREGDAIILTQAEHHSNIVPWQMLAERAGAHLRYLDVDEEGRLSLDQLNAHLADGRARLVTVAHVSNVLGTIFPVAEIVARARAAGAATVIDGSQAVPQIPVDVTAIGADFYAWTGHKAYGPTGVGILHGRREILEAMPPFLGGGDMIKTVDFDHATWNDLPWKFEAGTPPVAEVVGLGAAIDFLAAIGMDRVRTHERELTAYALERLADVPGLRVFGPADAADRGALAAFELDGTHPHDVAEIVARDGVCIRAGHHCAQPLMKRLGVGATSRASFAVHNTRDDVDRLVAGLHSVREIFRLDD